MLPIFLKAGKFLAKNSTTILTGVGVVGVIATTILTYKATEKTIEEVVKLREEAEENEPDSEEIQIDKADIFKASWKHWIPVVATVGLTITSIIAAHRISVTKLTALASAYKFSEDARKNYKQAVLNKFGEGKERLISDDAHLLAANEALVNGQIPINAIQKTGCGDQYIFIDFLGGYCQSSVPAIERQLTDYSTQLQRQGFAEASLDELLESMHLVAPDWTRNATWEIDREKEETYEIVPQWAPKMLEDGTSVTALILTPGVNMPRFKF